MNFYSKVVKIIISSVNSGQKYLSKQEFVLFSGKNKVKMTLNSRSPSLCLVPEKIKGKKIEKKRRMKGKLEIDLESINYF